MGNKSKLLSVTCRASVVSQVSGESLRAALFNSTLATTGWEWGESTSPELWVAFLFTLFIDKITQAYKIKTENK